MAARASFDPDPVDAIMTVMVQAFDPRFGEAWNRRQVSDALLLGNCRYGLISDSGSISHEALSDVAGFYLARKVLDEEELLLFAVAPRSRGKGLGAALLEDFISSARKLGAGRLFLEMRSGNTAGQLYEAHGFRSVGRRPAYYRGHDGSRHDAISFEYSLD